MSWYVGLVASHLFTGQLFTGLCIAQTQTTPPADQTPPASAPKPKFNAAPTKKVAPSKPDSKSPEIAPSAMVGVGPVPLGPYLLRTEHRDMLVTLDVQVYSDNPGMKQVVKDPQSGKTAELPKITPFAFKTLRVIFPMVKRTASSDMLGNIEPWEVISDSNFGYRGRLLVGEQLVDFEPEQLEKTGVATYGAWDFNPLQEMQAREVGLKVQFAVRAYATTFDERAAMAVAWPQNWPKDAQESLKSQLYIEQGINEKGELADYDRKPITAALKKMLAEEGFTDPKASTPVRVAKAITGQVWRNVNLSGDGFARRKRTSELMGMIVNAPSSTLSEGRGSPQDVVALLVALLREAGIPARPVIGIDTGGGDDKFLSSASDKKKLHSWVEFYLYDEAKGTHNWVPIDIAKMRKSSQRPPKFDMPWRGFGSSTELDAVAPFAVGFHPPQKGIAAYGAAGFWGWFVTPQTPGAAEQVITFSIGGVPRTTGPSLVPASDSKDPQKDLKKRNR